MKASQVILKLFEHLPKYTGDFSESSNVVSMTELDRVVSVELDEDHGLTNDSYVTLSGINVQNAVTSVTNVGDNFTLNLENSHDYTYGFHEVVKVSGFNEPAFNGEHKLIAVPNRSSVVVEINQENTPTGSGIVEEKFKKAYNGAAVIRSTGTRTFEFDLLQDYGQPKLNSNKAFYSHRIGGTASIKRTMEFYKKEDNKLDWIAVELGNTNSLRNGNTELNSNYPREQGDAWKQNLASTCSVYVLTSATDEKMAFNKRDKMVDYRKYIIASISGLTFDSGFSIDKNYQLTFLSDNSHYYDGAIYVHKFTFEIISEVSSADVNEDYSDIAFRDIALTITPDVGIQTLTAGIAPEEDDTPTLWTPSQISTFAWFDASDSDSIATVGGAVSQWDDKSGNGNHLAQATASHQPDYIIDGYDSKNIVRFSGTDYLDRQLIDINDSGFAIFMVFKYSDGAGAVINFNDSDFHALLPDHGGTMGVLLGHGHFWTGLSDNLRPFGTAGQNNAFSISSLILNDSSSVALRVNDSEVYNVAAYYAADTNQFRLGARRNASQYCNGDYCEFVVIKGSIETSDVKKIEGYLAHKWSLQSLLDESHIYKNSAPEV